MNLEAIDREVFPPGNRNLQLLINTSHSFIQNLTQNHRCPINISRCR
jgi:hypothetical protein